LTIGTDHNGGLNNIVEDRFMPVSAKFMACLLGAVKNSREYVL